MNFNVYLDDNTAKQLGVLARKRGKARNALVREAVEALLDKPSGSQWPEEVASFVGLAEFEPFESQRRRLADVAGDPFGAKR